MLKILLKTLFIFMMLNLISCSDDKKDSNKDKKTNIAKVFNDNCAECHGIKGAGLVKDWRKPLADGSYPPPPLNGTAHTWHHSPKSLLRTINEGGIKFGGKMPAFKNKLNDKEKLALIDYIYDLWPNNIKKIYDEKFKK